MTTITTWVTTKKLPIVQLVVKRTGDGRFVNTMDMGNSTQIKVTFTDNDSYKMFSLFLEIIKQPFI